MHRMPRSTMQELQTIIEEAFERRADITPRNVEPKVKDSVMAVIDLLDCGQLRVAERTEGQNWVTHQWIKKAVLLSFRLEDNAFIKGGFTNYYDKVPSKFADSTVATSAKAASAWCRRRLRARVPTSPRTSC
jgi:2,3,4,5-tetrahydropyridine-2-carboxylate N-succinyltransferase